MVDQVSFSGLLAGDHNTVFSANAAVFTSANGGLTVNSNIYVDGSGNIGIGTTAPVSKFSVAGAVVATGGFAYSVANTDLIDYTYYLDDISSRFDGITKTFPLTYNNGTAISPVNPVRLQMTIGGVPVMPARQVANLVDLTEFAVFDRGFTVSGSTVTFATPPIRGMDFTGIVRSQNPGITFNYSQTPFSALNIMFGP